MSFSLERSSSSFQREILFSPSPCVEMSRLTSVTLTFEQWRQVNGGLIRHFLMFSQAVWVKENWRKKEWENLGGKRRREVRKSDNNKWKGERRINGEVRSQWRLFFCCFNFDAERIQVFQRLSHFCRQLWQLWGLRSRRFSEVMEEASNGKN